MTGVFIPNKPRPCGGVDATKAIAMVKSGAGKNIHPSRPLFFAKQGNNPPPHRAKFLFALCGPAARAGRWGIFIPITHDKAHQAFV